MTNPNRIIRTAYRLPDTAAQGVPVVKITEKKREPLFGIRRLYSTIMVRTGIKGTVCFVNGMRIAGGA